MSRWQMPDRYADDGRSLDDIMESAFGPLPSGSSEPARQLSVEEAEEIVFDSVFTGHGHSDALIHEARQVVERGVVSETAMPATERGGHGKPIPAGPNDLLGRVVSKPGGRTPGFTEAQDRRIDQAYSNLWVLAESRLGMPHEQAVDHARIVFLECQHISASANELKDDFIARLEQRVAGYQAMSPLVTESKRGR